jgi:lipid-binding SYLF domain-containing protein
MKTLALMCKAAALLALAAASSSSSLVAQDPKLPRRVQATTEVLAALLKISDNAPPKSLLDAATCVAVVPGLKQAGLVVGGRAGFGLVSCRTPGGWSLPSFMGLKGGSIGLQIGGQSSDVVLVVVGESTRRTMASSSFTLGGEASIAAGPVGRNLQAGTDYKLSANIYSYSRSKGLFAGLALSGTKWEIDSKANATAYGAKAEPDDAVPPTHGPEYLLTTAAGSGTPALVAPYVTALEKSVGPGKP